MYSDKLVTAVKHNGRVLREQGETVFLPFGCEYSLHFKNLNSVRALVRVEIDGTNATEGTSLIVPAKGSIDLERFIKEGNFEKGNRFKFIERTKRIEDGPRGIKAEDGLIRVEFEFEQEPAPIKPLYYVDPWYSTRIGGGVLRGMSTGSPPPDVFYTVSNASYSSNSISAQNASFSSTTMDWSEAPQAKAIKSAQPKNDVGITVPGSVSDQKFTVGAWFPTDGVKHVMVLKLLGEVQGKVVQKPVTVKTKQECPTCGTMNKYGTKFCRECGTGLQQV